MLNIRIPRDRNGVPILRRTKIDDIGERLAADFCPAALRTPQPLDVDLFAEQYLGLTQDFQLLSHCGVYLGMMVFNDTDQIAVYDPVAEKPKFISAKAGTVIIDNTLLEESREHRYRFTMGHEGPGHAFLHQEYFTKDPNQLKLLPSSSVAQIPCRAITFESQKGSPNNRWTDREWMEWQANAMASAFLMPETMVRKAAGELQQEMGTHFCKQHKSTFAYAAAERVSRVFNVSYQAASIRLKNLGIIEKPIDQNHGCLLDLLESHLLP